MSIERSEARSELTIRRVSIERSEARSELTIRRVSIRWGRIAIVALLAAVPFGVLTPTPAAADDNCAKTGEAGDPEPTRAPWSQLRMQPERVWQLTTGKGVMVAVVDTGIWAGHAQLTGQVRAGRDFLGVPGGPSTADCTGHGTPVAGIIAARPLSGYPLHGVAPGASLLSIRAVDKESNPPRGGPAVLAAAIREAVARGARVINISSTTDKDDPQLHAAVDFALAHDVVVVAAAGNDTSNLRPELAAKAVYWPAGYDGVLAVAASDEEDKRAGLSHSGSYVGVAAPGKDVLSTGANGPRRYTVVNGSSFAAPFVSGTAALIRSYYPKMTARQVVARIIATADVPPLGRGTGLGAGIVNPYAAVTAVLPGEGSGPTTQPSPLPVAIPALPVPPDHSLRNRALIGAAVVVSIALLLAIATVVVPRGRARRWQPRRPRPSG